MRLELGPRKKELLLTQLRKDVELLSSLNIMDYSLLLGIHYISRGNAENIRSTTLSVYQPRPGLQRTVSKRKAREAIFNAEPRRLSATGGAEAILPSEEFLERKHGLFTSEDGGFYSTNDHDQTTGDIIYYFGVIDLLTTVYPVSTTNSSTESKNISKQCGKHFLIQETSYLLYLPMNTQLDLLNSFVRVLEREMNRRKGVVNPCHR
jgi:Phosphatidylinositol-4-phosphate 5-Kinase